MGRVWEISDFRHEVNAGVHRVSALAGGTPLWFETSDVPLQAAPEAFATALMLPALVAQAGIVVRERLDPRWLEGTRKIPTIYHRWWKLWDRYPLVEPAEAAPQPPGAGRASCFTGGVDSLYDVYFEQPPSEHLMFVVGFEVRLPNAARSSAIESGIRAVARRSSRRAVILRTNLRDHPLYGDTSWHKGHGSAIAAAGMVLKGCVGALRIPSTRTPSTQIALGSHPDTDPLWSTSYLQIIHGTVHVGREEKLRRLVGIPGSMEHLRVCNFWNGPEPNCSRCEKCVRTVLSLASLNARGACPGLDQSTPLFELIRRLAPIPQRTITFWEPWMGEDADPEIRREVAALIRRSRGGWLRRLIRRLWRNGGEGASRE